VAVTTSSATDRTPSALSALDELEPVRETGGSGAESFGDRVRSLTVAKVDSIASVVR
jgi:hypothetical protein